MKTITTKFLRQNLAEIVDAVQNKGLSFIVEYRSKPAFELQPVKSMSREEWLEEFGNANRKVEKTSPHPRTDKDYLSAILNEKYEKKYRRSLSRYKHTNKSTSD